MIGLVFGTVVTSLVEWNDLLEFGVMLLCGVAGMVAGDYLRKRQ